MHDYFMLTWIKKPKTQTTKHTKLYHDRYFLTGLPTSGSIRYVTIFFFPIFPFLFSVKVIEICLKKDATYVYFCLHLGNCTQLSTA